MSGREHHPGSNRALVMQTPEKIAVAGATGRVGRHVVEVLEAGGHDVVPISRSQGVDVITGEGLAEALEGVECIVDTATSPSPDEATATEFFTTASRNLHEAGAQAGVRRVVVVSIIGADRFAGGYGAAVVAHEQATLSAPIPALVLRAAQFHEFVPQLVEWGRQGAVSYVPRMRTQLVAARTVAQALAEMATDSTASPHSGPPFPEIAGPREERLSAAAELLVSRRGDPIRIEEVSDPALAETPVFESGGLLPGPNATLAGPTFEAWLEATLPAAAKR